MPHPFVHLRLHSEYSLVDSVIRIKPLVRRTAELGMPAVAVTDRSNLFAMVKFYKAARAAGVKPIFGADLWLYEDDPQTPPAQLVLLCQSNDGYRNLTRLVSRGYTEGRQRGVATLHRDWLEGASDGLIALSGGRNGDLGRALSAGNPDEALQRLGFWRRLFPDRFYLELQRTGREREEAYLHAAMELAAAEDLPVVATNDVCFLTAEEFEAHEARVCIHDGRTLDDPRRVKAYSEQQYLRSAQEMGQLFADIPEALANAVEIAKRCNVELHLGRPVLPDFPIPAQETVESFFRRSARQGLEQRLSTLYDRSAADFAERRRPYDERLETELDVIVQMGFPGYFLIVADFIQWAKDHRIPVGPGRGSGAGSLVAYALKITDLDPLAYDLLFERFLNPERVSMPDFDVDFCMDRRDRVIEYVADRYGRDRVSQIITYGSMAAKAVVRDVGRVLGHSYGFVDQIAKLIPFEIGMTLSKALEQEEPLRQRYEQDEEVRTLVDLARKLEGLTRNVGKHAGGIVIAPSALTDFTPLYCEAGSHNLVSQFDKDDVEAVGLVKFDFLGLRTLTIIDWALQEVNRHLPEGKPPLDIAAIPIDDAATFELLKRNATTAVFQLESRGMKELIKRLQPDCFEDIVALVALFRPGPLQSGMVDDFVNRKHGRAAIEYPHPELEPILKPTYGVILYQEQVMQIAQVLAGYSLGGADLLRRAIGKKKAEEMAKQGEVFRKGAVERGVDAEVATYIFDLMDKFAGYGFNKTVDKDTLIATLRGVIRIEDCRPGDKVFSIDERGTVIVSTVRRLHDHGGVPVWEVLFDDGTTERCTLDHKWLTRYGQIPLWKILQMGEQVWGTAPYQAPYAFDEVDRGFGQKGDMVYRRPVRAHFVGQRQGYDLEVDNQAHNFLLASGLCCSNSHSAAYALVSYQTAWLKVHHPAAFMAAVLSSDMDNTDKVVTFIEECRDMGLKVQPPDVNRSDYRFTVAGGDTVVYGLGAIKGVGEAAIEGIMEERRRQGRYRDLFDFCRRIDLRKANRRVLEALIKAGALDGFGAGRAVLTTSLPAALQLAEQSGRDRAAGQADLFGEALPAAAPTAHYAEAAQWDDKERLGGEKETLGLYLTGHPIDAYRDELARFTKGRLADLRPGGRDQKVIVAGLVVAMRTMAGKRGGRMAFLTLDDRSGRLEIKLFSDTYQEYRERLGKDRLLVVEGSVALDDFTGGLSMLVEKVWDIGQARQEFARHLQLSLTAEAMGEGFGDALAEALGPSLEGSCPVRVRYRGATAEAQLTLGPQWRVAPGDDLLARLGHLAGDGNVRLVY